MDILKIIGIALVSFTVCMIVRKTHPEIATQISIATGIIIFIFASSYLSEIIGYFFDLGEKYQFIDGTVSLILKITGICYICEFIVQILKDAKENITAAKVEFAGKLVVIITVLPVINSFLDMILGALT